MERVVFLEESDGLAGKIDECMSRGFRCIGVMSKESKESKDRTSRSWIMVRPGIVRPLPETRCRTVWVFDLNRVLGIKWQDEERRFREKIDVHLRVGRNQAVLFRPGARRLLKILHAANQEVWFWSTMQRSSVLTWRSYLADFVPDEHCLSADDCPEPDLKDLRVITTRTPGVDMDRVWMIDDDPRKVRLQPDRLIQATPYDPHDPFDPIAVCDTGMGELLKAISTRTTTTTTTTENTRGK